MIESPRLPIDPTITLPDNDHTVDPNESQNAKIKRIAGIALICVGLVLAAASFGVSYEFIALSAVAKTALGLAFGAASLVSLIVGTILKNKNTPAVESPEGKETPASSDSESESPRLEREVSDEESLSPRLEREVSDEESISPRVEEEYPELPESPRETDADRIAVFENELKELTYKPFIEKNGWDILSDEKLKNAVKKQLAEELEKHDQFDKIIEAYGEDILEHGLVDKGEIDRQVLEYLRANPKAVINPIDNAEYDLLVKYELIPVGAREIISKAREERLELKQKFTKFKEELQTEVNDIQKGLQDLQAAETKVQELKAAYEEGAKLVSQDVSALFEGAKKGSLDERSDSPSSEIGSPYFSGRSSSDENLSKYRAAYNEYQEAKAAYEADLLELQNSQKDLESQLEEQTEEYKKNKRQNIISFRDSLKNLINEIF